MGILGTIPLRHMSVSFGLEICPPHTRPCIEASDGFALEILAFVTLVPNQKLQSFGESNSRSREVAERAIRIESHRIACRRLHDAFQTIEVGVDIGNAH